MVSFKHNLKEFEEINGILTKNTMENDIRVSEYIEDLKECYNHYRNLILTTDLLNLVNKQTLLNTLESEANARLKSLVKKKRME